jgi:DnaJ homologue, subfamily C, member 28, conserved domain
MTERKPAGTSFTSWIDRQISEAAQRGAFDDLPGAGKPLPKRDGADDGQAWLREYLRREGVSAEELLPTPLKLRKEAERLTGTVHDLGTEQEVREAVAELNRRIIQWRRIPEGPPVYLRLLDEDMLVRKWHDGQVSSPSSPLPPSAPPTVPASHGPAGTPPPRRGWWRHLRRRRQPAG